MSQIWIKYFVILNAASQHVSFFIGEEIGVSWRSCIASSLQFSFPMSFCTLPKVGKFALIISEMTRLKPWFVQNVNGDGEIISRLLVYGDIVAGKSPDVGPALIIYTQNQFMLPRRKISPISNCWKAQHYLLVFAVVIRHKKVEKANR